jgi:DNA-binding CsgD family transcriptional regulator
MSNFVSLPVLQAYILASSPDPADQMQAIHIMQESIPFLEKYNNAMFLIRSRIVLALAYAQGKDWAKGDASFKEALRLAEPRNLAFSFGMLGRHLDDLRERCTLSDAHHDFLVRRVKATAPSGLSPDPFDLLTRRELEILQEVAAGATNKAIGNKLFISEKTVKRHIANIYQKLQIKDRKEARHFRFATRENVL